MISLGKYSLLEPMCIFSVDVSETVMKNMIDTLKNVFVEHIKEKKISNRQFKEYIDGFSYIPFFHLSEFHKYLNHCGNGSIFDSNKYVYGVLVMDGFLTGSVIRMDKKSESDREMLMTEIGFELLNVLKIFSNGLKPIYLNKRDLIDIGSISKKITKEQFMKLFDEKYDSIKILLGKYTPTQLTVIDMAKDENMPILVYSTLNVAFQLMPEQEVNLKCNPDGYDELVTLLSEYELDVK